MIALLVYVGGGGRNHFRKKREFIWIIMNPCGQEWASGRQETQFWNAVGNPWSIFISPLRLFLCNWFIVHSFCWLATSTSQDSQHKKANYGLTEGPNLSFSVFFSLATNPNIWEKIPVGPASPPRRNGVELEHRVTFYKMAASFLSLGVLGSV